MVRSLAVSRCLTTNLNRGHGLNKKTLSILSATILSVPHWSVCVRMCVRICLCVCLYTQLFVCAHKIYWLLKAFKNICAFLLRTKYWPLLNGLLKILFLPITHFGRTDNVCVSAYQVMMCTDACLLNSYFTKFMCMLVCCSQPFYLDMWCMWVYFVCAFVSKKVDILKIVYLLCTVFVISFCSLAFIRSDNTFSLQPGLSRHAHARLLAACSLELNAPDVHPQHSTEALRSIEKCVLHFTILTKHFQHTSQKLKSSYKAKG